MRTRLQLLVCALALLGSSTAVAQEAPVEAAPAAEPPAAPAPPPAPAITVMDLQASGVQPEVASTVTSLLTVEVARFDGLRVVSSEDIRRMLDAEASKQAVGCDDESCLAEIASALGARYVMWGTVGRLDELLVVTVNLYDADEQRSVARESGKAFGVAHAPKVLRPMATNLLAPLLGHDKVPVPEAEQEGFTKDDILGMSGTAIGVAGLVVLAVGVVVFGAAYGGEIIGTIATSGGGYEYLIPFAFIPIAGPVLVVVLGEATCLEIGAGCVSFVFQLLGCAGCLAGGAGAGLGFAAPCLFGGDDKEAVASVAPEESPPRVASARGVRMAY